jgi:hypothetical protein
MSHLRCFAIVLLPLLILISPRPGQAHPGEEAGIDVRGVVTDSTTGERILGANIVVLGTTRGAVSNVHGFYLIPSLAAGEYRLIASALGFTRKSVKVSVRGDQPITLDIRLSPRLIESREVVVQSQFISPLTERSASVHVVTPQELERIPSVAQPDFLRSLQLLPGFASTSDVSAKFFVRGGAGDQNLILLDGMRIYNPFHAFGVFSVLDPDIVRTAEVYTGAFPAGYGGRLSSVVNVSTRDGNTNKLSGNANINFLSGKLELDGPILDDNAWLISGRSSLFNNSFNKLLPNPSPTTFYDMFAKATFGTSTGRIGFRAYMSGDDIRPEAPDQPMHSWRNSAASGVLSSLVSDRLYFDASVSFSNSTIERLPKPGTGITPASSQLQELSVRTEMTSFGDDQNNFFEGFEFNFPMINDVLYTNNVYEHIIQDSGIEWYAWLRYEGGWEDLRVDLGAHADFMSFLDGKPFFYGLQPRFTISYKLDGNWLAKVSYGIFTQRIITISNEDDLITLFDAWLLLPRELRPEVAIHYVAGIQGNILPPLAATVQVYAKDYSSLTLYNSTKFLPGDPDYIDGTGKAYGIEALLRYSSNLLDLYGSYSFATVSVSAAGIEYYPRYDRRHTVKAIATVHITDELDMSLRWDYGSGYPFTPDAGLYSHLSLSDIGTDPFPEGSGSPLRTLGDKNSARLPAYHRLDGSVNYRLIFGGMKTTLGISVINVYNAKNILYYDRTTGKTDYMTPFFPSASLSVEF